MTTISVDVPDDLKADLAALVDRLGLPGDEVLGYALRRGVKDLLEGTSLFGCLRDDAEVLDELDRIVAERHAQVYIDEASG